MLLVTTDRLDRPAISNSAWRLGTFLLPLLALACCPVTAVAWGPEAHRLVASLAERQLAVASRADAHRLLSLQPGATLVSISTEADDTRTAATAPWHYVNIARDADCRYDAARDCAGGQCVVSAIETQIGVLSSAASDLDRLQALKYLVHLVADLHQPLHAAFADDRGGNRYQVQAFGAGTNLHAVWDVGLIENWPGGSVALRAEAESLRISPASSAPSDWAAESCRVASAPGFYPSDRRIGPDYVKRWKQTALSRLVLAARRLAGILNANLEVKR